jgi:glycosyltransferase involved in cell wall biosynthesis
VVSDELGAASVIKKFNLGAVSKNNEKDYAEAILRIYAEPNRYSEQSKKASEFIKKNLGWDVFTDKMIKAYKDAWRKYKH